MLWRKNVYLDRFSRKHTHESVCFDVILRRCDCGNETLFVMLKRLVRSVKTREKSKPASKTKEGSRQFVKLKKKNPTCKTNEEKKKTKCILYNKALSSYNIFCTYYKNDCVVLLCLLLHEKSHPLPYSIIGREGGGG